jgi:hypothetical protein
MRNFCAQSSAGALFLRLFHSRTFFEGFGFEEIFSSGGDEWLSKSRETLEIEDSIESRIILAQNCPTSLKSELAGTIGKQDGIQQYDSTRRSRNPSHGTLLTIDGQSQAMVSGQGTRPKSSPWFGSLFFEAIVIECQVIWIFCAWNWGSATPAFYFDPFHGPLPPARRALSSNL